MKRFLFLALFVILCNATMAQSPDALYNEFMSYPQADGMRISPFMMKLARMATKDDKDPDSKEALEFLKRTKRMALVDLDKCSEADKKRFVERISNANLPGYERIIDEEEGLAVIYFKYDGKRVSSIISASLNETYMFSAIEGNFDIDFANAYAESQKSGENSPMKLFEDDEPQQ